MITPIALLLLLLGTPSESAHDPDEALVDGYQLCRAPGRPDSAKLDSETESQVLGSVFQSALDRYESLPHMADRVIFLSYGGADPPQTVVSAIQDQVPTARPVSLAERHDLRVVDQHGNRGAIVSISSIHRLGVELGVCIDVYEGPLVGFGELVRIHDSEGAWQAVSVTDIYTI